MKALKKQGEYRLYRVNGHLEIWCGVYNEEQSYLKGVRVGGLMYIENFEYAVEVAKDEVRCLIAEGV